MSPTLPYTIRGTISGTNVDDLRVKIENVTTGDIIYTYTDSSGNYLYDAANFDTGYTNGNTITVTVSDYQTDFKWKLTLYDTNQILIKETNPPGTGKISFLSPFAVTQKLVFEVSDAGVDGDYKLHFVYYG